MTDIKGRVLQVGDIKNKVIQAQKEIINQLVDCETSIEELYTLYSESIPELHDFFHDLAIKEKMHAALLKSMHRYLQKGELFHNIGRFKTESIKGFMDNVNEAIKHARKFSVRPEYAIETALSIESSFVDAHFYDIVESDAPEFQHVAKRLSKDTKEHVKSVQKKLIDLQDCEDK